MPASSRRVSRAPSPTGTTPSALPASSMASHTIPHGRDVDEDLEAVLAGVAGPGHQRRDARHVPFRDRVVAQAVQRHVRQPPEHAGRARALQRDKPHGQRTVVEHGPEALDRAARASLTAVALAALATTMNRSSPEPVDDQVVEDTAFGEADHRVVGAADLDLRRVRCERVGQRLSRAPGPRRIARPCATGRRSPPGCAPPDAPRGCRSTGAASTSRRTRPCAPPGPRVDRPAASRGARRATESSR